jgi:hypothetical protein
MSLANPSSHMSRRVRIFHLSLLSTLSHLHRTSVHPANNLSTARQKLVGLTREQFQGLCTDVYDELMRRNANSSTTQGPSILSRYCRSSLSALVPFLPAQAEFHPKRNQARQKLSSLLTSRFQDLCYDVRHELGRRYPGCKEEVIAPWPLLSHCSTHRLSFRSLSTPCRRPSRRMTTHLSRSTPILRATVPGTGLCLIASAAFPKTRQVAGYLPRCPQLFCSRERWCR